MSTRPKQSWQVECVTRDCSFVIRGHNDGGVDYVIDDRHVRRETFFDALRVARLGEQIAQENDPWGWAT